MFVCYIHWYWYSCEMFPVIGDMAYSLKRLHYWHTDITNSYESFMYTFIYIRKLRVKFPTGNNNSKTKIIRNREIKKKNCHIKRISIFNRVFFISLQWNSSTVNFDSLIHRANTIIYCSGHLFTIELSIRRLMGDFQLLCAPWRNNFGTALLNCAF